MAPGGSALFFLPTFRHIPFFFRLPLAALPFLLAALPLQAKPRSGVTSPDFDGKPSGARYIGAGETGAALSGMPESPIWNPAALNDLAGPLFSADFDVARHSRLGDDVVLKGAPLRGRKLTYLGFAGPDGAFFYRPLASFNERTVTDPADPANNFTEESLKVSQFGFTASQSGEEGHALGLTLSYLNARRGFARAAAGQPPTLELADGNGFSLDMGMRVRRDYWSWGLAFFNIPGIVYWNLYKPDQMPVLMRTGASFHPVPAFALVTDYEKRFYRGGLPKPDLLHLGMELAAGPWLQLRGGTFGEDLSDVDKTFYTAGFSVLSPKSHRVDFALKTYRLQKERVYNYFISVVLPLPEGASKQRRYTRGRDNGTSAWD